MSFKLECTLCSVNYGSQCLELVRKMSEGTHMLVCCLILEMPRSWTDDFDCVWGGGGGGGVQSGTAAPTSMC